MPSQPPSSLSQKLNSSVHKLTRKMKKPKDEIMPGELDSTEVQLARFFGKHVDTFSSSTTSSTASVTPTPSTSSIPTTASSKFSSSSYSFSLSPTTSLASSSREEGVSGRSASPSAASDGTQSPQLRHRKMMAQEMEKMRL